MARSEQLVVLTVATWERSIGRVKQHTRPAPLEVDPTELAAAVRRMAEVAEQWRALPHDGALTFTWPRRLTFDPATSHRGRRSPRRTRTATRR